MSRGRFIDIHPVYQRGWQYIPGTIDGVMIQLTNGIAEQMYLAEIWDQVMLAKDDGCAVIGYHYLRSGWSWQDQLKAFKIVFNKYGGLHGSMLDGEGKGNLKEKEFALMHQIMMDGLIEMGPSILYAGRYHIQDWIYPWTKFLVDEQDRYPLMIAQYPYRPWTLPANEQMMELDGGWSPVLPAGRTEWSGWQFSADGNKQGVKYGLKKSNPWTIPSVDLDVWNGTSQDFKEFWQVDQEDPPEPLPDPVNCDGEVKAGQRLVLDQVIDHVTGLKNSI